MLKLSQALPLNCHKLTQKRRNKRTFRQELYRNMDKTYNKQGTSSWLTTELRYGLKVRLI
ncbi:hypothetical protein HMPREF0663_11436 [Hoylesella oralis ATCC 33269]|uniref:Uncharacterized protein n=1 Tax=Hoylesella oralis ATCC 33269 TaxID=873533 RepID=E7RQI5_9BACT|nr:hypothetical protein HMPREF0663_11436 [Hoylesella oralis ATCC 33269]